MGWVEDDMIFHTLSGAILRELTRELRPCYRFRALRLA